MNKHFNFLAKIHTNNHAIRRWISLFSVLVLASAAIASLGKDDEESKIPLITNNEPTRSWEAPTYGAQKALGYGNDTFLVPDGLKERVNFWVRIYSEFGTDEGVIHDEENIHRVYKVISFKDFAARTDLTESQKSKMRRERVKNAKDQVMEKLAHFQRLDNPDELSEEDAKLYHLFDSDENKLKFAKASHLDRLRFQLGQKDRFMQGVYYSGRYLQEMEEIFKQKGLPIELTRLPFVESSFNIYAMSRVGASGIWQIMPRTGRELRLKVESRVDDRNDVLKATEAASRILKTNYDMLGAWPLALTAYNHGAYGIKSISQRMKTTDITKIVNEGEGRRFGFASSNFYACFLAALEVEKNAKTYFPEVKWSMPLKHADSIVRTELNWKELVEFFSGDDEMARLYNPHFSFRVRRGFSKIPAGSFIRVPENKKEVVQAWLEKAPRTVAVETNSKINNNERTYRMHRGDTLLAVAKKFQVSVNDLKTLNGISNPRSLRPGKKLVIPD